MHRAVQGIVLLFALCAAELHAQIQPATPIDPRGTAPRPQPHQTSLPLDSSPRLVTRPASFYIT